MTSHRVHDTATHDRPSVGECLLPTDIRFVEFFGLPGIGKTTTSSLLAERLQQCGFIVDEARIAHEKRTLIGRQIHRIGLILPRLIDREFRSIVVRIARFVAQGGQETPIDLVRVTWNLCGVAAYIMDGRSKSNSITILDQGLLQAFFSVLLKSRHKKTSEDWLDILSAIGVDDIVFVDLRGEIDLAQDRLRIRGDRSSRLQRAIPKSEAALGTKADRAYRKMTIEIGKRLQATDRAPTLAAVDMNVSTSPEQVADRTLQAVLLACRDRHWPTGSASR